MKSLSKIAGFTLIEVLISMCILVFIVFGIFQATTETYHLREVLSTEGDFYTGISLAIDMMRKDYAALYTPSVLVPPSNALPTPPPAELAERFRPSQYWDAVLAPHAIQPSRFIGTDSAISWITAAHTRIYHETHECTFSKVSYEFVLDEKNLRDPLFSGTYILVKKENTNAFSSDDTETTFIHQYNLVYGIKKWKYTYYQKEENTFKMARSWDSNQSETKMKYPDIIELTLEVIGTQNHFFEGIYRLRPESFLNFTYDIPSSF